MLVTSPKALANLLRDERQKREMTQSELGANIELRQKTISDFENAPDKTRLETLFKILATLNLQLHIEVPDSPHGKEWSEEW